MKVAIVGSSNLTDEEVDLATHIIGNLIQKHNNDVILTGDARGIDFIVRGLCKSWSKPHRIYEAKTKSWDSQEGFKNRKIRIAQNSDFVYSISTKIRDKPCYHCTTQNHQRTGGCWTLKYAKSLGKKGELILI